MHPKSATTQVRINDLIANRWSPRSFDTNKPVSDDDLIALFEAARWAPSCFNDQPWRYVVCNRNTDSAAWRKALELIAEKNQLWAKHAPVLILSVAMSNFNHNGKPNRWAMYDTGAASLSLCLQANALGLIVHQMGGFHADLARQVFKLPEDCTPMAMMAVGYQADLAALAADFHEAEQAERVRNPLQQSFFMGEWGKELS